MDGMFRLMEVPAVRELVEAARGTLHTHRATYMSESEAVEAADKAFGRLRAALAKFDHQ